MTENSIQMLADRLGRIERLLQDVSVQLGDLKVAKSEIIDIRRDVEALFSRHRELGEKAHSSEIWRAARPEKCPGVDAATLARKSMSNVRVLMALNVAILGLLVTFALRGIFLH